MKEYPEILRELREDNDLTQQEIADILGTTQQVYSRYEKGINEIPVRHIITLCKYYKISSDYVLGLTDEQK
ncbi:MAG: helix-turn-helix transcriptional regulator [Clostridia bacterium]|nr:helix-turn-helix transcriptional regulator [Clostridia bacterium]